MDDDGKCTRYDAGSARGEVIVGKVDDSDVLDKYDGAHVLHVIEVEAFFVIHCRGIGCVDGHHIYEGAVH
jgi:hypothetical protein